MWCRGKAYTALLLAVALFVAGAGRVSAQAAQAEIIGIYVRGQEKEAVDALLIEDHYYLPVDAISDAIGVRYSVSDAGIELRTPLGKTLIPSEMIHAEQELQFVSEEVLADVLGADVSFSEETYGLMIIPPWAEGAAISDGDDTHALDGPFDAEPPAIAVSSLQGDIFHRIDVNGQDDSTRSVLDLYGNALDGVWRLGFNSDFREMGELAEYAWLRQITPNIWTQVGRQRLGIHPLIGGADYTGAQLAYSNQAQDFNSLFGLSGGLLDRYDGGARRFYGLGPPGGRVELLIDDQLSEIAIVDVNGDYEIESRLIGGGRNDIEIRVFDPITGILVDRERQVLTANSLIAPGGSVGAMAGIGVDGNAFDSDDTNSAIGFAWARYAPTDSVTLEAAAIAEDGDRVEATIGTGLQFGEYGTFYGAVSANQDGDMGYEGRYFGEHRNWTLLARARSTIEQDSGNGKRRENDRFAELLFRQSQRLRYGLLARDSDDATYILPTVVWRPVRDVNLSARPNRFGDYQFEARASIDRDTDIRFFHEYDSSLRLARSFDSETVGPFLLTLDFEHYDLDDTVGVFAGIAGSSLGNWPVRWRLRAGIRDDTIAGSVGIDASVAPGVHAFAEASHGTFGGASDDTTLTLGLSLDIGFRKGGVVAANRVGIDPRKGRLAGKLNFPDGFELPAEAMKTARIVVAGKPGGRIEQDGTFWLADLPEGAYDVEVEADHLPIELANQQDSQRVRIAPGAVTTIDFPLTPSLGVGGRVTGPDGANLAGVRVEARDDEGQSVAQAVTSQFGLFRLDGLSPGRYTLSSETEGLQGTRQFEIVQDYLFGVDFALSPVEGE